MKPSTRIELRRCHANFNKERGKFKGNKKVECTQVLEIVRGKAVPRGGCFSRQVAALHPEGYPAGHSGRPVDRDPSPQLVPVGGPLLEAARIERERREDVAGGASPLEDRSFDLVEPRSLPVEGLVQVVGLVERFGAERGEHAGREEKGLGKGGGGSGQARIGRVIVSLDQFGKWRRLESRAPALCPQGAAREQDRGVQAGRAQDRELWKAPENSQR